MIKTIRLSMEVAALLMNRLPQLKIIHLLRDPRGMIRSTLNRFFPNKAVDTNVELVSMCNQIRRDIEVSTQLKHSYPGRIITVLYEHLAEHPEDISYTLFDDLDLVPPVFFKDWLHNHTTSGLDTGRFGTQSIEFYSDCEQMEKVY